MRVPDAEGPLIAPQIFTWATTLNAIHPIISEELGFVLHQELNGLEVRLAGLYESELLEKADMFKEANPLRYKRMGREGFRRLWLPRFDCLRRAGFHSEVETSKSWANCAVQTDRKSKKSVLTQIYGVGFWLPDEEGQVLR